ncbi:MAG: hypothetical protein H6738_05425 [Alphaproteobacteria bacterium]|nr:hypothetical protein [Alphaproteobacteria bacterium]MCB9696208.1 hypothetical protein [Alphaproteobacteria bacterium]
MGLPLVPEIREARAHVLESQRAALDLAETDGAAAAAEQLARTRGARPDTTLLDLTGRLAADWALPALAADPDLASVRAFLALAQRHLRPIARSLMRRVEEMQELQVRQQAAMEEPAHRDLARRIHDAIHRRDHLMVDLNPVDQAIGVLEPTIDLVATFAARIEAAAAEPEPAEGARGRSAWLACGLARTVVESLDSVLSEVRIEGLPQPAVPELAPEPELAALEVHLAGARRAVEDLGRLREALIDELQALRERSAAARAEHQELDRWLLEEMG